jgi:hypothetical protein
MIRNGQSGQTLFHFPVFSDKTNAEFVASEAVASLLLLVQLSLFRSASWCFVVLLCCFKLLHLSLLLSLRYQASNRSLIRLFQKLGLGLRKSAPSSLILFIRRQVSLFVERETNIPYEYCSYPCELNSWIIFRQIFKVSKANNLFAFLLWTISNRVPFEEIKSWQAGIQIAVGACLILISMWFSFFETNER